MADPPPFSGIVLAGGRSARMGRDKAFLDPGDGGPVLAARAAAALRAGGAAELLAIGGDLPGLRSLGFVVVPDGRSEGPLRGLVLGLTAAAHDRAVVLSCDLPAIDGATVAHLAGALHATPVVDAVVPVLDGHRQVLVAAYRRRLVEPFTVALDGGERSLRRALTAVAVHEWTGADPRRLVDLDLPADVAHYARMQPFAGGAPHRPFPMGRRRRPDHPDRAQDRRPHPVDVPEIDVATLATLHPTGITLIDVRNPDEYEGAHVPGARLIPLPELTERAGEVPAGEPVYVICAMGGRSRRACEFLATQGHDVTNIAGGTNGWIDAGHPVSEGTAP